LLYWCENCEGWLRGKECIVCDGGSADAAKSFALICLEDIIASALRGCLGHRSVQLHDGIDRDRLAVALRGCDLSEDEEVIGWIDCSVFPHSPNALIFTPMALYCVQNRTETSGSFRVLYSEFAQQDFTKRERRSILLGTQEFDLSGSALSTGEVLKVFNTLKWILALSERIGPLK
jgi:hypothetical protein